MGDRRCSRGFDDQARRDAIPFSRWIHDVRRIEASRNDSGRNGIRSRAMMVAVAMNDTSPGRHRWRWIAAIALAGSGVLLVAYILSGQLTTATLPVESARWVLAQPRQIEST